MNSLRILVVDDEPSHLITLAANLELEGIEIVTAGNAQEALQEIARHHFDLVLSDVKMPGMNGVDLFRQIRLMRPSMPVILMTGFAFESLLDEAMREGAFAVLPKPFDIEQVLPILLRAGLHPTTLIVDSSQQEASATARALQDIGVRAQAVFDEQSAVRVLHSEEVDICVVDLLMAVSGTPALIERMKQIKPGLSFIAVSARDVPEFVRKLAGSETLTWLRKPLSPPILARSIAAARGSRVVRR
jgi:two-component system response regulator HydG